MLSSPDGATRTALASPARPRRDREQRPRLDRMAYAVREVSVMLGVSQRTIRRWMQAELVHSVTIGRRCLIPARELEALLNPPGKE